MMTEFKYFLGDLSLLMFLLLLLLLAIFKTMPLMRSNRVLWFILKHVAHAEYIYSIFN